MLSMQQMPFGPKETEPTQHVDRHSPQITSERGQTDQNMWYINHIKKFIYFPILKTVYSFNSLTFGSYKRPSYITIESYMNRILCSKTFCYKMLVSFFNIWVISASELNTNWVLYEWNLWRSKMLFSDSEHWQFEWAFDHFLQIK